MTGERTDNTPLVPLIVIRVEAPTASVDDFVGQYCRYFGSEIMFLPTEGFQPPGRRVRFAFALTDGREILWGEGVVMRMRRDSGNPHRPPGMELRYDVLDEASQSVVDRMLALRLSGAQMGRPEPPPYVSMWLEHDRDAEERDDKADETTRPRPQAAPVSLDDLRQQLSPALPSSQTLPANPFADVTREALEYFIEWALQRITEPPRRRRVTAEIATLSARPPARAMLAFVAGVAVTVIVIGITNLMPARPLARRFATDTLPSLPWPSQPSQPSPVAEAAPGDVPTRQERVTPSPTRAATVALAELPLPRALPPARPLPSLAAPTRALAVRAAEPRAKRGQRATLSLHATPADAWLRVDGGAPAHGPLQLSLAPGAHEVVVERPRYATARLHVEAPGHLSIHLSRPPATLRVTSTPAGADVTLDGRGVGVTPLELTVTGYELHRVDIVRDGLARRRRVYVRPPFSALDVQLNQSARRDTRSARYPPASARPASL